MVGGEAQLQPVVVAVSGGEALIAWRSSVEAEVAGGVGRLVWVAVLSLALSDGEEDVIKDGRLLFIAYAEEPDVLREAMVLYDEPGSDVAVLQLKKMDREFDFCKFGRKEDISMGMEVFSISNPLGLEFSFLMGYVSLSNLVARDIQIQAAKFDDDLPLIQVNNVKILSGASGGPLFDGKGRVIGMCSFGLGAFTIRRHSDMELDIDTKRAALKASPSVVSVVSYKGGKMMFPGSGTIIDCEEVNGTYTSTILTSTTLLGSSPESNTLQDDIKVNVFLVDGKSFTGRVSAYDFHFNIATICITSDVALPTACLRPLDVSIPIYPSDCNSNSFRLGSGDMVVAIGRCGKTHELIAAPGKFRKPCRPWLGMELTNLHTATIGKLDKVFSKFNISRGVLVKKVINGSPAEQAGILHGDIIVQCGEKEVQSSLEFYDIWEKVRLTEEVVVLRESSATRLNLKVFVDETIPDKVNRDRFDGRWIRCGRILLIMRSMRQTCTSSVLNLTLSRSY
ncbi:hypothetical protein RHGRI_019240 [Rhododendron griersonianum]|uniref:PDZ domain-containing protein n=1 Tax=Rhododendron griersonianum TaxID=479676 RepID=A0AAV6JG40_9ERIC|nr:hypothetical protein RHGRI_019240 [Rhododendron griersonianum]KAG5538599.1 hypothetical protein RHGRI_019240 [Rhododendron griersonianum]